MVLFVDVWVLVWWIVVGGYLFYGGWLVGGFVYYLCSGIFSVICRLFVWLLKFSWYWQCCMIVWMMVRLSLLLLFLLWCQKCWVRCGRLVLVMFGLWLWMWKCVQFCVVFIVSFIWVLVVVWCRVLFSRLCSVVMVSIEGIFSGVLDKLLVSFSLNICMLLWLVLCMVIWVVFLVLYCMLLLNDRLFFICVSSNSWFSVWCRWLVFFLVWVRVCLVVVFLVMCVICRWVLIVVSGLCSLWVVLLVRCCLCLMVWVMCWNNWFWVFISGFSLFGRVVSFSGFSELVLCWVRVL